MPDVLNDTPFFPMQRDGKCPLDPPPGLGRLQRTDPVSRVSIWDGSTPWLITAYETLRTILTDPRVSSNSDLPGYPHVSEGALVRRSRARSFIAMDDPEHAAQRRVLMSSFTVKRMERMRGRIQALVDALIDDILKGPKPIDLVESFALPVPSMVICELLGVPYADRAMFHGVGRVVVSRTTNAVEVGAATDQLLEYLRELVTRKAADPGDDLFSRLATEQLRTGKMTSAEIAGMGLLLLLAGHETTANMIALGTVALLANPEQLQIVRASDDPQVISNAVEELLRYLTITHSGRRRVALEDISLPDCVIRAGEGMIGANDIANRDPNAFPNPDLLDVGRAARHHLAFGYGVHQCLGQSLARIELQVVFGTLYRRIPTLALAAPLEELPFKHDMAAYGVHTLPVTW